MISELVFGLLKNKWVWIILGVIILSTWTYTLYTENQRLQFDGDKVRQNEQALKDSLERFIDTVQILAVKVTNLNTENFIWKGKYVAVDTKYQIAIDSLKHHGHGVAIVTDSTGTVTFDSTEGIVTYYGDTFINVKTKESRWSISIKYKDIFAESWLFQDTDELWKIRTESLVPGIKLRGLSTIDDEILRKIRGVSSAMDRPSGFLAVGGMVQLDRVLGGVFIKPSNWMFGVHYMLYDNTQNTYLWSDRVVLSLHYFLF